MAIWKLALAASVLSLSANSEAASVVYEFSGSGTGSYGGKTINDFIVSLAVADNQMRLTTPTSETVVVGTADTPFGLVNFTLGGNQSSLVSYITGPGIDFNLAALFDNSRAGLTGPNQIFTLKPGSTLSYDSGTEYYRFSGSLTQLRTYTIAQNITGIIEFPSAVPEPSTWALMLAGFGMVGYAMRRRKLAFA